MKDYNKFIILYDFTQQQSAYLIPNNLSFKKDMYVLIFYIFTYKYFSICRHIFIYGIFVYFIYLFYILCIITMYIFFSSHIKWKPFSELWFQFQKRQGRTPSKFLGFLQSWGIPIDDLHCCTHPYVWEYYTLFTVLYNRCVVSFIF